jgi:hypothetical protein
MYITTGLELGPIEEGIGHKYRLYTDIWKGEIYLRPSHSANGWFVSQSVRLMSQSKVTTL